MTYYARDDEYKHVLRLSTNSTIVVPVLGQLVVLGVVLSHRPEYSRGTLRITAGTMGVAFDWPSVLSQY